MSRHILSLKWYESKGLEPRLESSLKRIMKKFWLKSTLAVFVDRYKEFLNLEIQRCLQEQWVTELQVKLLLDQEVKKITTVIEFPIGADIPNLILAFHP